MRSNAAYGCLLVAVLGCGHTQSTQLSAAQAPAAQAPAAQAPAATAQAQPAPQPKPEDAGVQPLPAARDDAAAVAAAEARPAKQPTLGSLMSDHFTIVVWARDAVVDGDLERLREPLRALADYRYESLVPGGWMAEVAQLQAAARLTSQAQSLAAAALGVSTMTRICAQCHREQKRNVEIEPISVASVTPKKDDVETRMYRHAWANELLWEGLMGPSDSAWQAGAAALAHAPVPAPKLSTKLPKSALQSSAESFAKLRDLGLRATYARTAQERADIYGAALATCANCHAQLALAEY